MTKYQIITTPNGIRAKEINPYRKPQTFRDKSPSEMRKWEKDWQTAEASLKEYMLDINFCEEMAGTCNRFDCCQLLIPEVGSIVEGEIINGKLKIK